MTAQPVAASRATTFAWGNGDTYTIVLAVIVLAIGCVIHREALKTKPAERQDIMTALVSSGLTAGPLLMILVDPFNKLYPMFHIDLLKTVVQESRITLWFACFLAFVNTAIGFFRKRI